MSWRVMFQVAAAGAWALSLLVVVRPTRLGIRASLVLAGLLALAFGKFACFSLLGGDSFVPELPEAAICAYGVAYSWATLLTALALAAAIVRGALRVCGRAVPLRATRAAVALSAALSLALAAWGMYEGTRVPDVRRVELAWRDLPPAFDGYRIVHMSDLHCSSATRRGHFERIVARVNSLGADLVALTGDFVDGSVERRGRDLEPLAGLRARDGVVGCTGNHEKYSGWDSWGPVIKGWGVAFPEESGAVTIRRGGDAIAVGAMADPTFTRGICRAGRPFAGTPDGAFRVLLFHRPWTDAPGSAAMDVALQLSGHTHGGITPPLRPLVSGVNEGHSRGLYEFAAGRYLYLSPGTGQWAGFPLRLFNPTEITEIVLRRRDAGAEGKR